MGTTLLLITKALAADELSGCTNNHDFQRPCIPKIGCFSEFFSQACGAHFKSEQRAEMALDGPKRPAHNILIIKLSTVSFKRRTKLKGSSARGHQICVSPSKRTISATVTKL